MDPRGSCTIRHLLVSIVGIVAALSVVAGCSSPTSPSTGPGATAGATPTAVTAAVSPSPAGTTSTTRGPASRSGLAAFLAEARQVDARLRRAAALINAGIGDDVVRVDQAIVDAVHAAEPDTAARAVPTGLAPETLRLTLVVYNDLVSRHAAMGHFVRPGSFSRAGDGRLMLTCLANGAAPAARFLTDLASLDRYAASRPAATPTGQDPEPAAGLAVRLELIRAHNQCADECGSGVFTDLAKLSWTVRPTRSTAGHGELEGVTFTVTATSRSWAVRFNAC